MLTEICQDLRNWFNRDIEPVIGIFTIADGSISNASEYLKDGQYFRVIGSVFNDGVHKYGDSDLQDETFTGSVWPMAVPKAVIDLDAEIEAWTEKNADTLSGPYVSESFGGYSYSLARNNAGGNYTWRDAFRTQLSKWRKI